MQFIGHAGLALATSISALVHYFILISILKKKLPVINIKNQAKNLTKITFLSLIILLSIIYLSRFIPQQSHLFAALRLVVFGILGIIIMVFGAQVLDIENSKVLGKLIWKKLSKK